MVKPCTGIRVQWPTESLELAVSAKKSGTPLAAASAIHGIQTGHFVAVLVERNLLTRNLDKMQSCLWMLQKKRHRRNVCLQVGFVLT
jgi:hypothetical protein